MKIIRYLKVVLLGIVFVACLFGALASLEPTATAPIHTGWFIGYLLAGSLAGGCVVVVLRRRRS